MPMFLRKSWNNDLFSVNLVREIAGWKYGGNKK